MMNLRTSRRIGPWLTVVGTVAAGLALLWWWTIKPGPTPADSIVDVGASAIETVLTDHEKAAVARALESGRVVFPDTIRLLRGQLNPRSSLADPGAFDDEWRLPEAPVGIATNTPRPTFAWRTMPGATGYSVVIFDERLRTVAESKAMTETAWAPARDLPRGRLLAWRVTAHVPEGEVVSPAPPQPGARFVVLTRSEAADLAEQRERLSNEPIALGLALTRLGLFDDAKAVLEQALNDARFDQAQVQALLSSLEQRGR